MTATKRKSDFKLTTDDLNYGVSILMILKKIDRVITAPRYIYRYMDVSWQ